MPLYRRHGDGAGLAPAATRYCIGGTAIDVASDIPAALHWLAEFLEPAFTASAAPSGAVEARHTVYFETSGHDRLQRSLVAAPLSELEAFTFDGSFSRHRGWDDPDGTRWIHDKRFDTFLGVDLSGGSVRVVAKGDGCFARLALMRAVRELATSAQLAAGKLPVHGAAFVHEGVGVLACGPKRSGKTSLLLHALRCGASFVSNDRLFVDCEATATAEAMPTIVMLREGTLAFFDDLAGVLRDSRFDRARTLAECEAAAVPDPEERSVQRRGISPAQLCHSTGAAMRASTPVGVLLFPRIDPAADGLVLEPMSDEAARETLGRSLLKPSHPTRCSPLFSPGRVGGETPAEVESRRCDALLARVPAYDCRMGPDAFWNDLPSFGGRLA
jgi:hypothetical protein